jgi:hypothetical protein
MSAPDPTALVRAGGVVHRADCTATRTGPPVPWPPATATGPLRTIAAESFLRLCTTCKPLTDQ